MVGGAVNGKLKSLDVSGTTFLNTSAITSTGTQEYHGPATLGKDATLTASTFLSANIASNSDDPLRSLATLTLLVGVILLVVRLLRLGGLVDSISEATLIGIKGGVNLRAGVLKIVVLKLVA